MLYKYNDLTELKKLSNLADFDTEYNLLKSRLDSLFTKNPNCVPLYIAVTGSVSYGIDTETSDIDAKLIYFQTDIVDYGQYNVSNYIDQIASDDKNDITGFEIGRYFELLSSNNPNIIELLNTDEECVIYKHPIWDKVVENLGNILSKRCYYTFFNYSKTQIEKSRGLNKKINQPMSKERKSPIDFCSVIEGKKSSSLREFLKNNDISQTKIGLAKIPNARDLYSMYIGDSYSGVVKEKEDAEVSNEIRLSNIEKDAQLIALLSYNKDGYTKYCKDYNDYWGENGWMNRRNEARYNDNLANGQDYDCYIESETEFLTKKGWKKFDEIADDEEVGTVNPNGNFFEWNEQLERFDKIYKGIIYTYENRKTRFSVTDNHILYLSETHRKPSNNYSIEYIRGVSDWEFKSVADYHSGVKSVYNMLCVAEINLNVDYDISDDMLRLIGSYVSEGSLTMNKKRETDGVSIGQLADGKTCDIMNKITTIDYVIYEHIRKDRAELTYTIRDKEASDYIINNCGRYSEYKKLPDDFYKLSKRQFDILLESLMAGDGHVHRKGHSVYYTTSKILTDQLQQLLLINGYNNQIYGPYKRDITRKDIYQIFISNDSQKHTTILNKNKLNKTAGWCMRETKGERVVCFTVKNSILVTRNKNKLAIQGNCKNLAHSVRLTAMAYEIAQTGVVRNRRTGDEREFILGIRKGSMTYDDIIAYIENIVTDMKEAFDISSLPELPDTVHIQNVLRETRKILYEKY